MHALTPPTGGHRPGPVPPQRRVRPQAYGAAPQARRDPAPSRLVYRLNRMWLSPLVRRLVRVGLPAFMLALVVGGILSDEGRRETISGGFAAMVDKIQHQPQFEVRLMKVEGASDILSRGIRDMLPVALPASSFDFDLNRLRDDIAALDAVAAVDMRIRGGVLEVNVTERTPAILWRGPTGIEMLDASGHRTATVTARDVRPDLPVVAGEGADRAIPEALSLIDAAGPILPRLRGLERMGERRWDVVLDRGQRIMLPETDALRELERAIALDMADRILARDVTVLDMRNPARPTVRMGPDAMQDMLRQRGVEPLAATDGG